MSGIILLPSRGRPEGVKRFLEAGKPKNPGIVILDEDDPRLPGYALLSLPEGWTRKVLPKTTLTGSVNKTVADVIHVLPDFIAFMADDAVPETPDWEQRLADACGFDGVSFAEDGVHGRCTHYFVGGDLAADVWDARGWFFPPQLKHLYTDTFWEDIGKSLNVLRKQADVMVRHLHYSVGKSGYDETYAGRQTQGDSQRYAAFLHDDMAQLLRELRK